MNVYEVITSRMLELLDKGTVPWRKPWTAGGYPKSLTTGKDYRGVNVWLLHAAGFESPFWITYKAAQEQGGTVRKGEKGWPVVFWKFREAEETAEGEKGESKAPILRYYTVFNLAQCDGVKAPAMATPDRPHTPIESAEALIRSCVARPQIQMGHAQASYSPSLDVVRMPNPERFGTAEDYYHTMYHELTHSTGHKDRLARKGIIDDVRFGSTTYSQEELVAEMGASYLMGHAGLESATIDNAAAYIAGWRKKLTEDARCVVMAAAQAQKAVDYMLGVKFSD